MKKIVYIGIIAVCCTACGVGKSAPLDDAYYWPDKSETYSVSAPSSESSQYKTQTEMEYLNVQDTTITVKIKR